MSLRTLTPTPATHPGPRLRRGRTNARAPEARKPCPSAPRGEGLWAASRGYLATYFHSIFSSRT
ncbi:hypothetical protein XarjCFBP1022_19600 [Xanthomonas arboricola]|nr:hypothetical protein XarbCFBP7629_08495 [Xanthomonas arboricola]PPT49649.1 hypothetical protein XarjCFBP7652_06865 [Xanthomonas arboricola]PPU06889.1 hypothetical protein XarjCFBP1022_19600 [Xanthomonas arboricola]